MVRVKVDGERLCLGVVTGGVTGGVGRGRGGGGAGVIVREHTPPVDAPSRVQPLKDPFLDPDNRAAHHQGGLPVVRERSVLVPREEAVLAEHCVAREPAEHDVFLEGAR